MSTPPAGWYPDPQNPATMRWFDGTQWTEHVSPVVTMDPNAPRGSSRSAGKTALIVVAIVVVTLLVLGILAAIAIPVWLNQSQKEEFASSVRTVTCEQVVDEAVELSHRDLPAGYVALADVTDVFVVADERAAVLIQSQLAEVGFTVNISKVDSTQAWNSLVDGKYQGTLNWWYNETPDPDLAVRWAVCGSCGSNSYNIFYANPKVDELVEQGTKEVDEVKRADIYKEIQKITTEEVAQIPLYYAPNAVAYSKRLQGLKLTPSLQWTLEEASIGQ